MVSRDVSSTAGKEDRPRRGTRAPENPPEAAVGGALRSVYDEAVGEAIPQEMLDLLGRLG